jgi:hemerythrin
MAFLKWTEEYSVGVAVYDAEHMQLMAMVNDVYESMFSDAARVTLRSVLNGLIAYTERHFKHEEDMLAQAGYPLLNEHKMQHDLLKNQVLEFSGKASDTNDSLMSIEISKFLKTWLLEHIQKEDKKYGQYLNAKGIR